MRQILMYIFTFFGIGLLAYVRISGANRVNKTHPAEASWTPKEKKLLFISFGLIIIGLVLAFTA